MTLLEQEIRAYKIVHDICMRQLQELIKKEIEDSRKPKTINMITTEGNGGINQVTTDNLHGLKTLHNTTASQAKDNVKDIVFWGNGDTFKLISKASSKKEGWMKSTKAMEIDGVGCVVQVTTQQWSNIAEAVTFVPGVAIQEIKEGEIIIGRKLVKL